jgi:hypothetical protein
MVLPGAAVKSWPAVEQRAYPVSSPVVMDRDACSDGSFSYRSVRISTDGLSATENCPDRVAATAPGGCSLSETVSEPSTNSACAVAVDDHHGPCLPRKGEPPARAGRQVRTSKEVSTTGRSQGLRSSRPAPATTWRSRRRRSARWLRRRSEAKGIANQMLPSAGSTPFAQVISAVLRCDETPGAGKPSCERQGARPEFVLCVCLQVRVPKVSAYSWVWSRRWSLAQKWARCAKLQLHRRPVPPRIFQSLVSSGSFGATTASCWQSSSTWSLYSWVARYQTAPMGAHSRRRSS